jgi:Na+/H+-dicarboxylate symporter
MLSIHQNFLRVIVLGASFGVALTQLQKDMPPQVKKWDKIVIIQLLEEVMQVFMKFVGWIIKVTPFAIISLIAAAVGAQSDLGEVFAQIGVLIAAILVGLLIQVSVVYSGLYTLFVRKNPLKYYKHLIPAWMMAFASSSSAATIPVSLECVVGSGEVPVGVARFVVPLGSTSKYYLSSNYTGFLFQCHTEMSLPYSYV